MKKETVRKMVYDVLNEDESTRKDDYVLIAGVIKKQKNERLSPKEMQIIVNVFKNWHYYNLPNIHSIFRERRYLQVKHPHLMDETTQKEREAEETYYHDTYKQ